MIATDSYPVFRVRVLRVAILATSTKRGSKRSNISNGLNRAMHKTTDQESPGFIHGETESKNRIVQWTPS
ncbi:hypothetical protein WN48_01557 [Eufriesea mexicana]|nr:hypothetical protein WN48_01557 [Eufriesea mexicana]